VESFCGCLLVPSATITEIVLVVSSISTFDSFVDIGIGIANGRGGGDG